MSRSRPPIGTTALPDEMPTARIGLYKADDEIAELIGVGRDKWREIVKVLEMDGFPKRNRLFCGRRYWPACRVWLDEFNGLASSSLGAVDGAHKENWQ